MKMKKMFAILLSAAMAVSLLAGCGSSSGSETTAAATEAATEAAAEAAGGEVRTEGTGTGRNGDIKVAVTLDENNVIKDIEVLEHEETEGVGTPAFDLMIPLMIENNSIGVDAVSSATITSEGLREAVSDALASAGLDPADYMAAVSAEKGEDTEYTVDVAIIGAGGAGLAAAASASAAGASVVVLEKSASTGGNTKLGEGTFDSADYESLVAYDMLMTDDDREEVEEALAIVTNDPDLQSLIDDLRADYEEWEETDGVYMFDSVNWHAMQTYTGGDCIDNIPLIRLYADQAPVTLEWLEDEIGVPFRYPYIFMAIGGKWTRGHQVDMTAATGAAGDNGGAVYIDRLEEYAKNNGVDIELNADVTSLIMDGNAVVGCVAERTDGSVITVNAPSVIIATGGYGANAELVLEYSNGDITTTLHSCSVTSTGDGLFLAEEAGGNLINLEQIQVHPLGDPIDDCGCVSEFVGNWANALNYVFVNKEGERFIKEDETRANISNAELGQTDGQMWLIVDSKVTQAEDVDYTAQIEGLESSGHTYEADTLEELAELIDVDPDVLIATIDEYNAGMEAGTDAFGKSSSAAYTIEEGPFYASLRTPTVHYTMGGIEINPDTQVIGTDGDPIPGLYAAGEVASGIHGTNRLGGNAYPDIMTFGKIAGEQAAAYAGK